MNLIDFLEEWNREIPADDLPAPSEIQNFLSFRDRQSFHQYQPSQLASRSFWLRMRDWLASASNVDDQRLMFRLAAELQFFGLREMNTLYQVALYEKIVPWIIEHSALNIRNEALNTQLDDEIKSTLYCGLTDMDLGAFCRINLITGQQFRPMLGALSTLGDQSSIRSHISVNTIRRVAVIEDFVGTGNQMIGRKGKSGPLKFISDICASLDPIVPVIFVPLIICPDGHDEAESHCSSLNNVRYAPVIRLPKESFIPRNSDSAQASAPDSIEQFRQLVTKYPSDASPKDNHGYKGMGATVVIHTNCPNNTVLMVHHETQSWQPLFPRSVR